MFGNEPISPSLNTTRKLQQASAVKPIIKVPEANPFTIINLQSFLQANSIPNSIAPAMITARVIDELKRRENKVEINCGKDNQFAEVLAREGTDLIERRTGLTVEMKHEEDDRGNSYITYITERPIHIPTFSEFAPTFTNKSRPSIASHLEAFWESLPENADPFDFNSNKDRPSDGLFF